MTRNTRIGLLAAAVVVAVVAFVIAQSGGDDSNDKTSTPAASGSGETTETTDSNQPAQPQAFRIDVKGGVVDGDTQTFTVKKNDRVRIIVTSDAPDQIHLHGYDIEKEATPGKPARFDFKADVEGAYIIESHAAEDAGKDPLLARLHVEP
jgi:FtsP/CotA-like multicopper oxidase with cupredoxin domain